MFSSGIKSPKRTYFLGVSYSWPHTWQPRWLPRQALTVSTTWNPWGAAGKTQKFTKLAWQQLPIAPQNINPSLMHTAPLVKQFQEGQQLPEARGTKEGEVGGLQCHPEEDQGGDMGKAILSGHSWRSQEVLCAGGGTSECVHPQVRLMLELRYPWRVCGLCVCPQQN